MIAPQAETVRQTAAVCPMHAAGVRGRVLQKTDELVLPLHKRVITQFATAENGERELRL